MKFITYYINLISVIILNIFQASSQTLDWAKCYGGSDADIAYSIQQTSDSGYLIVGETASNDGLVVGYHPGANCAIGECRDLWVVKTDSYGNFQWQKTIGGSKADVGYCSFQSGSNYIVAGVSGSSDGDLTFNNGFGDGWMVNLDSIGNIIWSRSYGGSSNENIYKLIPLADKSIIAFGRTTLGHGAGDLWLFKLDSLGNMLWEKFYGGSGREYPENIELTADDGFAMFAQSESSDGDVGAPFNNATDYWMLKVDSLGNIQWSKTFGGSDWDFCYGGCTTSNHGYLITGTTYSNDGDVAGRHDSTNCDAWTIKTDSLGNVIWKTCLGGSWNETMVTVLENEDGNFVNVGYTLSNDGDVSGNHSWGDDAWFVVLSPTGTILESKCFGSYSDDDPTQAIQTLDGSFAIVELAGAAGGDIQNHYGGNADFCIIKILPLTTKVVTIKKEPDFSVYPNPARDYIVVNSHIEKGQEIMLFNIYNEFISSIKITSATQKIDLRALPSGIYFLRSQSGLIKKFLKE